MTPSTIYFFNLYSNLQAVVTCIMVAAIIAFAVHGILMLCNDEAFGFSDSTMAKIKKRTKISFVVFIITGLLQIFAPSPKSLALMYGVDYLNKLNSSAEVSGSQVYKDITTIIHNYAMPKESK